MASDASQLYQSGGCQLRRSPSRPGACNRPISDPIPVDSNLPGPSERRRSAHRERGFLHRPEAENRERPTLPACSRFRLRMVGLAQLLADTEGRAGLQDPAITLEHPEAECCALEQLVP